MRQLLCRQRRCYKCLTLDPAFTLGMMSGKNSNYFGLPDQFPDKKGLSWRLCRWLGVGTRCDEEVIVTREREQFESG
jgi:hypothetical protein